MHASKSVPKDVTWGLSIYFYDSVQVILKDNWD